MACDILAKRAAAAAASCIVRILLTRRSVTPEGGMKTTVDETRQWECPKLSSVYINPDIVGETGRV